MARFEVSEGWCVQALRFTLDPTEEQARWLEGISVPVAGLITGRSPPKPTSEPGTRRASRRRSRRSGRCGNGGTLSSTTCASTSKPGRRGGRNARKRPTPMALRARWTRTGTGRAPDQAYGTARGWVFPVSRGRDATNVAQPGSRVGVDVGVRRLATVADADGVVIEQVENPRPLDAALRELRHLCRARSRCTKGSRRYRQRSTESIGNATPARRVTTVMTTPPSTSHATRTPVASSAQLGPPSSVEPTVRPGLARHVAVKRGRDAAQGCRTTPRRGASRVTTKDHSLATA